ncbi:RHS repeat domain-containing protein [Chryseobacterium mucoviscidosis]|uniref:RHS repeat-associated core domain-containing protein n=2 Tax=Chryseobacterium group TaxID=2782232 RepID=A0A3D9B6H0_9FLAO|nr:RHS repeat-associated core domain-containing protein [Chryseobacterium mucoviscidosis]REC49254.1 hypothetical protein DRF68_11030 [Candidatus Chryseobacterium massiliae]
MGSSSFITGLDGEVTQNMEYFPSGEIFVENHMNDGLNSQYKFNGKEMDGETGYYYYGARYYNPKVSLWLNVDPLAEALPDRSPYEYTLSNPIRFTDPTGMYPNGPGDENIRTKDIEEVKLVGKRESWFTRNIVRPIKNFFKGEPNLSSQQGA